MFAQCSLGLGRIFGAQGGDDLQVVADDGQHNLGLNADQFLPYQPYLDRIHPIDV